LAVFTACEPLLVLGHVWVIFPADQVTWLCAHPARDRGLNSDFPPSCLCSVVTLHGRPVMVFNAAFMRATATVFSIIVISLSGGAAVVSLPASKRLHDSSRATQI
jgi:hypothetical protein